MASYKLEIKAAARKDLARLQPSIATRIAEAIENLADEPHPAGSRKLKGFEYRYRIRVGDYRVIYEIRNSILTVFIIRIGHRKDIYR
ncbi:type II toxin-antitoxin system RelE/ParE family toxin [bacterium]|nr:type II toxin-antitoxin system RelE/ParE family toxin [bacterium]